MVRHLLEDGGLLRGDLRLEVGHEFVRGHAARAEVTPYGNESPDVLHEFEVLVVRRVRGFQTTGQRGIRRGRFFGSEHGKKLCGGDGFLFALTLLLLEMVLYFYDVLALRLCRGSAVDQGGTVEVARGWTIEG